MSTQFGAVIGTLEYMSPEQAGFSGVDIDTRADIYSLGVILYELLTGLRPIDAKRLRNAALTEMIRIIREEEPSKPSTRLSTDDSLPSMAALRQIEPRKLMALLRGELDWVVMKCLEKHRERRYETANALARDIQRYLADEAVEARPPSAGYRFSKFLRRNTGPVLAASLVLLALVGGIVGTTFGMLRANRARADEAKQRGIAEANEAKAVLAAEAERTGEGSGGRAAGEGGEGARPDPAGARRHDVVGHRGFAHHAERDQRRAEEVPDRGADLLPGVRRGEGGRRTVAGPNGGGGGSGRFHRVPPGPNGGSGGGLSPGHRRVREAGRRVPRRAEYRTNLADSHNNLGILLADLGKLIGGGGAVSESPGDPGEAGRRIPRRAGAPQGAGQVATTT